MTAPGEITVELMQQILREAEKDDSILVLPNLEVHELNEDLHGGSSLSRVIVKYMRQGDKSHVTQSLLVKLVPLKSSSNSGTIQQSSFFDREIQMFNKILPRMSTLLSQALPDFTDFSARAYFTRNVPSFLIAIEDLSPKGFRAPNRITGLDLKHSIVALRTIARFHAASVIIRQEDKSLFAIFDKNVFLEKGLSEILIKTFGKLTSIIAHETLSWPEFEPSLADNLQKRSLTVHEDLQFIFERDDSAFNVLDHGDFGIHNVMYRHSETSGELETIMLVDFQCCNYNSPVLDLHQFIFASASDDVKEHHIDTLLREYHDELTATLEALGAPRDQTISLPQLQSEFNNKMLFGFCCGISMLLFHNINSTNKPGVTIGDIFNGNDDAHRLRQFLTDSYLTSIRKMMPAFVRNNTF